MYKRQIQVNVFLGGALGDENESVRMLARGQIQGVGVSTLSLIHISEPTRPY